MNCAGCRREIEVGDHYIEDTPSGFMTALGNEQVNPELDDIMAMCLGGTGTKIVYCEDCTREGGDYKLETYYGDEADAA